MWKLEKPLLDDAIRDIDRIVFHSNNEITNNDKPHIIHIYRLYDRNGGTIHMSDNNRCSKTVQERLYVMYDRKTYEGQDLYYIRKELFKLADICPMCGFGEPSQLDHQMPRDQFKSLSLCRLNLVPICGVCNNKKRNKNPADFVHPYYTDFPNGIIFLVANIHINEHTHKTSWVYSIETNYPQITTDLADKINKQVSHIKLKRRLQQVSNTFIADLFFGHYYSTEKALKTFLQMEMNSKIHLYGLNDWRSTLLSALFYSSKFKKEEANLLTGRITPFNRGVNV